MTPLMLRWALALSLLLNAGVFGAALYQSVVPDDGVGLPRHLGLNESQERAWREAEEPFLRELAANAQRTREHRDRLIGAIFAGTADEARIEAERQAIARIQEEQQKLVVAQLLRERYLLDARQQERLAELLLRQPVSPSAFERLHRE